MTFELTEEFVNAIISAMDNQTCSFAVNAQDASLVEISDAVRVDDDKFYSLPEWGSADGFAMREDFLKQLHAPLVKEKLQQVMHSGRGVFKNFREVLKDYPEIDKNIAKNIEILHHNVYNRPSILYAGGEFYNGQ